MKPIDEQHIAEPGLVMPDITGREDTVQAVMAVMAALEGRWATSGVVPAPPAAETDRATRGHEVPSAEPLSRRSLVHARVLFQEVAQVGHAALQVVRTY